MAVWLGSDGGVKIERTQSDYVYAEIAPADVDPGIKRFGLSKPVNNLFITGDRLEITRVDASGGVVEDDLDFVAASGWPDNKQHLDGAWHINVDPVGGIRVFILGLRISWIRNGRRCIGDAKFWLSATAASSAR